MGLAVGVLPVPALKPRLTLNGKKPGSALATVSLAQVAYLASPGSESSHTVTLATPSTSGNTLVAAVSIYGFNPTAVTTVTALGDGTNTFSPVGTGVTDATGSTNWLHSQFYVATGITGKATEAVTYTVDAPAFLLAALWELSPAVLDQESHATGVGTVLNAGSITPPVNGAFACMAGNHDSLATATPNAGWTLVTAGQIAEYIAQATAGPLTPSLTGNASGHWTATAITLIGPS